MVRVFDAKYGIQDRENIFTVFFVIIGAIPCPAFVRIIGFYGLVRGIEFFRTEAGAGGAIIRINIRGPAFLTFGFANLLAYQLTALLGRTLIIHNLSG